MEDAVRVRRAFLRESAAMLPAQLEATYYVRWVPQSKKQGAIIALQTLMQVHRFIDGDLPERLIVHRAN